MILYNSSDILRYLYGLHAHDPEKSAFLKPTKEALEMESKIDKMGFNLRRYAYYHLLLQAPTGDEGVLKLWGNEDLRLINKIQKLLRLSECSGHLFMRSMSHKIKLFSPCLGIHVDSIPQWQKILLRFLLPVLKKFLLTILKVDRDGAAIGLRKSKEFFKETDELLSDGRKFLLGTEEPTFVDFSFATLAAIHVLPDNYGGSQLNAASKPRISDTSAEHKKDILEFAKTPSGKFVARMYKDYREV